MIYLISLAFFVNSVLNIGLEKYKTSGIYGYKLKYNDKLGNFNEWLFDDLFSNMKLYKYTAKYSFDYEIAIKKYYGPVKNDKQAIEIAESIWLSLYGFKVYKQFPFKTKEKPDRWIVYGGTYEYKFIKEIDENKFVENYHSGCPVRMEIRKKDGKILALD